MGHGEGIYDDVNKKSKAHFLKSLTKIIIFNLMASNDLSEFNNSNDRLYFYVDKVLASKSEKTWEFQSLILYKSYIYFS